jgi:hypothetical protein
MGLLKPKPTAVIASVVLTVAIWIVSASGVAPGLVARLSAPLGNSAMQATLVSDGPTAGEVGTAQAPATGPAVGMVRPEEASTTLEEKRAHWFQLIYEGRNFDPGPQWDPVHP